MAVLLREHETLCLALNLSDTPFLPPSVVLLWRGLRAVAPTPCVFRVCMRILFFAPPQRTMSPMAVKIWARRENGSPDIGAFLVVFLELSDRFGEYSMAFKAFRSGVLEW